MDIAVELFDERLARGDASGYRFVIADDRDGRMIGWANFGPISCTLGSFDLYWIVVDPAHQGRGLGRALVREVERRAASDGGRRIYIETSSLPKYDPTRRFYLSCGYTLEATLAEFYAPGDAKQVYAKALTP